MNTTATRSASLLGMVALMACHAAALAQDRASLPPQLLGPIVGQVTPAEAMVWLHVEDEASHPEVIVQFRSAVEPADRVQAVRPKANPAEHNAIKARLTGLRPATTYQYEVLLDGTGDEAWQGRFTTPVAAGKSSRFKLAVSSCMDAGVNPVQSAWYLLLAEKPDLQLLLGDNVYANTTDRELLWRKHRQQRRVIEFAAVLRNVPTYAMWDDHDYGPNDSDGTQPGKENSLVAFKELWANPAAGTDDTPGAFYRFGWGDVEFFMLDGRYHRSPDKAPNDDKKRMLGDAQFKWLASALRESQAKFKVLGSGSTLMVSLDDGWRVYDFDRKRLYQTIMGQKIPGVLYLSGDIHRCLLDVHSSSETLGYPLYEVISSGIANSKTQGFATLEFDTAAADPSVRIKIIHGDATTRLDRTVRLSELQIR
jgi:alkaline phosphatase D